MSGELVHKMRRAEFEEQKPLDFVYQCEQGFFFLECSEFFPPKVGKNERENDEGSKIIFPEQRDEKINKYRREF